MRTTISQRSRRPCNDEKGFTLLELLVAVVITGVLIAVALPLYLNYRRGANDAAAQSDLRNSIGVLELCQAENGGYPATDRMSLQGNGGTTGDCNQTIALSEGTQLIYRTSDGGVTYTITATNRDGSGKVYCYSSATGGQVVEGAKLGSSSCSGGVGPTTRLKRTRTG